MKYLVIFTGDSNDEAPKLFDTLDGAQAYVEANYVSAQFDQNGHWGQRAISDFDSDNYLIYAVTQSVRLIPAIKAVITQC